MNYLYIGAIVLVFLLVIAFFFVDYLISAPKYRGPKSDHFDGKKFINPDNVKGRGLMDMLRWSVTGERREWAELTADDISFGTAPRNQKEPGKISVTFINHSSFLIQVDGLNILTDPVFSKRVSPFSWVGPKRQRPPGIRFDDLPEIDIVLLSHNHYDHLDINTVTELHERYHPVFMVPLGVDLYLHQQGIKNTVTLDWWQEGTLCHSINVTSVPAQHFSGRGIFDRDTTLWCGYVLETSGGRIYFAGDTAYGSFFQEIGERMGPIELALIPIGAYHPRWFMQPIHTDPEEAILIHQEVGARQSIGTHFGTFPLADEGMKEPPEDLAKARAKHHIDDSEFITLQEGETNVFQSESTSTKIAAES